MSVVAVNDVGVVRGTVSFGLRGTWYARLLMQNSDDAAVTGSARLAIGDVEFTGTATATKDAGNAVTVEVVGGAGGLATEVEPQHYVTPATVRTVLNDALGAGGESLSSTVASSVVDAPLSMWTRVRGTVSDAVKSVLEPTGASWRFLDDGTVWVGQESWPTSSEAFVLEEESPATSQLRVAIERAGILPGVTVLGRQVSSVVYSVDPTRLRADLFYGLETSAGVQSYIDEMVRKRTAPFDFYASYQMKFVGQNGDGTLELQSGDARLPNMSKIPLLGIPGMKENQLLPNTLVMLSFRNGDPAKPFAYSADMGQALALTLSSVGTLKLEGTAVEAGGNLDLVLHTPLLAWVSALTAAGGTVGLAVPPLTAANTTITKGA